MTDAGQRLAAARLEVTRSRARLDSTMGALRERMSPKLLVGDVVDGVRLKAADAAASTSDFVGRRPAAAASVAATFALLLFRKPIARGVGSLVDRITGRRPSKPESTEKLETPNDRHT